jgi:uncharacterized protein (TIGR02421 family)
VTGAPSRRATVHDPNTISEHLIQTVAARLRNNKAVRRTLPESGRVAIDRQLPFLIVYRQPVRRADNGTERFANSEASYLVAPGRKTHQPGVTALVRTVAETMVEQFGSFLVLEVWSGPTVTGDATLSTADLRPRIRFIAQRGASTGSVAEAFAGALGRVRLDRLKSEVTTSTTATCCPRGMSPILKPAEATEIGCEVYGLEISPVYRDPETGEIFPRVLRLLRRSVTVALRRGLYDFVRNQTTHRPRHFHTLGRRTVVKAVWEVDRILAEVSESFDFLLQVTPVNGGAAWNEFKRKRFNRSPLLLYRPTFDEPVVLKRRLYKAPVERIEDPALAIIFREKIDEIDRQITMLQDRNSARFLPGSIQLYGRVEDGLQKLAADLLDAIPPRTRETAAGEPVDAAEFARRAEEEIAWFRRSLPDIGARVEVRRDVTGLMVSRGNLLVSAESKIPASRVDALIQHEVGTHVLTYHNGRAQPLRHLYTGLAGYDALQEGLAVLSEYLVGGLSRPRLRLLAGRVVAAVHMIDGATFVETFRELDRTHGFSQRTAFTITLRTYRGGGLTKDVVYLRGLQQILEYLGNGGRLRPLFVGKIGAQHIPVIRELQWRGVLKTPPLIPRYMESAEALERLDRVRGGLSVADLCERKQK